MILRWRRDILRRRWAAKSKPKGRLRRVLAEYESFYNSHLPHRSLGQAAPLKPLPGNVVDLDRFRVIRCDRIGGILHEYHLAA